MSRKRPPSQRIELFLAVSYPRLRDLCADHLADLGDGGLLLRSDLPLDEGTNVSISLRFDEIVEPLAVSGVVRWRKPAEDGDAPCLGVELLFESEEQRARFRSMVDPANAAASSSPTPPPPPPVFRVLIIEENEHMLDLFVYTARRFHAERLAGHDLDIVCATSGAEALDLAASRPPDLAIVDGLVADMSGARLIGSIREVGAMSDAPIIAIGSGGGEEELRFREHGADAFLDKPVQNRKLMAVMSSLLGLD